MMPARTASPNDGPELVKMSTLARRSGVPAATIKHYLREGLLPQPDVRTSRNMALYDARLVARVKAIKELQRTKFLPLKVIKGVLDTLGPDPDAEAAQIIQRVLDEMAPMEARTRKQLLDAGVPAEELDFFRAIGLLTPEGIGEHEVYVGDDLALLRVLGESRKAGISPAMLPASILEPYARAIRELVRVELRLFREGVIPQTGDNLQGVVTAATKLSEQLVVILRRKLILPTLKALASKVAEPDPAPANDASPESEPALVVAEEVAEEPRKVRRSVIKTTKKPAAKRAAPKTTNSKTKKQVRR
jgi:DNA-binding transcriptional MerR regulator